MNILHIINLINITKDIPWINGWNESYANDFCTQAILGDTAGKVCSKLSNVDFNSSIANCVKDIQVRIVLILNIIYITIL